MRFKRKDNFSLQEFKAPPKEYRGVPFWSWNCSLDDSKIKDQLAVFEEMGFGGAIAHSRNGLEDEYIGDKFMDEVRFSAKVCNERDLDLWLYDEDRWPSGSAGGKVTKDALEYRQKSILFTKKAPHELSPSKGIFKKQLAAFFITLDSDGCLKEYRNAAEGEDCIYVHEMIAPDNPRYNGGANIDALSEEAVAAFIESTYAKYKNELGEDFGDRVSAIFTDEPQTDKKFPAPFSDVENFDEASFPWTSDFADSYRKEYGEDLIALLPQLIFELPAGELSRARYRYHEHLSKRFRIAYTKQIGDWCRKEGISFTGHLLLEESVAAQSKCVGDISRCYTDFDIPGIDVLCAKYEYTTAKQAQSVARQDGKRWIMSELYGVTGWQSDFRDYKHWGDWQAALGVTIRVPHLNWMSMLGGGKRDYPACFGYQAPWYREFARIEDYFARLGTVLTAGDPSVRIAVVHPVESYWLTYGPLDKTGNICKARDDAFLDLAKWLLLSGLDFDYLNESLLPSQYKNGNVGEMSYDVVLVPDCITLRSDTLRILSDMKERGIKIIFAGRIPSHADGAPSTLPLDVAKDCVRVEFTKEAILGALLPFASFRLYGADGMPSEDYISHVRTINGEKWILLVPGAHISDKENTAGRSLILKVPGCLTAEIYDAMTGNSSIPPQSYKNGYTETKLHLYSYDSVIVRLSEGRAVSAAPTDKPSFEMLPTQYTWDIRREEPNVCLLDMGEYSFDGVNYMGVDEILRIDTAAREKYGLPTVMGKFAYQPWAITEDREEDLWLRFSFDSLIDTPCELAFERILSASLNGEPVSLEPVGYYVDKDFTRVALPPLRKGRNTLTVHMTVTKKYGAEPMYLLGDFDVQLSGIEKTILPPSRKAGFSSAETVGMPFYGGNIVYSRTIDTPDCTLAISVRKYRGALVGVRLDGKDVGELILPPYELKLEGIKAGSHTLELCLYGNRHNTFGSLHCAVEDIYYGPTHWQKADRDFSHEYCLRPMGIMIAPEISILKD